MTLRHSTLCALQGGVTKLSAVRTGRCWLRIPPLTQLARPEGGAAVRAPRVARGRPAAVPGRDGRGRGPRDHAAAARRRRARERPAAATPSRAAAARRAARRPRRSIRPRCSPRSRPRRAAHAGRGDAAEARAATPVLARPARAARAARARRAAASGARSTAGSTGSSTARACASTASSCTSSSRRSAGSRRCAATRSCSSTRSGDEQRRSRRTGSFTGSDAGAGADEADEEVIALKGVSVRNVDIASGACIGDDEGGLGSFTEDVDVPGAELDAPLEPGVRALKRVTIDKLAISQLDRQSIPTPTLRPVGLEMDVSLTRRRLDGALTDIAVELSIPAALMLIRPGLPVSSRVRLGLAPTDDAAMLVGPYDPERDVSAACPPCAGDASARHFTAGAGPRACAEDDEHGGAASGSSDARVRRARGGAWFAQSMRAMRATQGSSGCGAGSPRAASALGQALRRADADRSGELGEAVPRCCSRTRSSSTRRTSACSSAMDPEGDGLVARQLRRAHRRPRGRAPARARPGTGTARRARQPRAGSRTAVLRGFGGGVARPRGGGVCL